MGNEKPRKRVPWDLVALGGLACFAVLLCLRQISAMDYWWQLATGRYVLQHGWPRTDAFSFSVPDHPWVEMRWLYCVLLALLDRAAGGAALAILAKAAATIATLGLVLASTVTRRTLGLGLFLTLLALLALNNRLYVRPEMVTYLLLAFFLFAIHRDRSRGFRWSYALPAVQVLWTNAHTLFVLGPAVVGAWVAAEATEWLATTRLATTRPAAKRRGGGLLRRSAILLGLSLAACLVNPWFLRGALFPLTLFRQLQGSAYSSIIGELASPFHYLHPNISVPVYLGLGGLVVLAALASLPRLDPFWTLVTAAFAYLSLTAVRNVPLFVLAAVPFVVHHAAGGIAFVPRLAGLRRLLHPAGCLLVAAVSLAASWAVVTNRFTIAQKDSNLFGLGVNPYRFPAGAADFLEEQGIRGERVFCNLNEGSYLLYRGYRVFFDPRLEVYGEKHLARYRAAVQDDGAFRALEREFHFPVALVGLTSQGEIRLARRLRDSGGWRLVYLDHAAAVLLAPGFAPGVEAADLDRDRKEWTARWRRVLPVPPAPGERSWLGPLVPPLPYQQMGVVLGAFGREDLAEPFLRDALRLDPDLFWPNATLGRLALGRREAEDAVRFLARALGNVPGVGTPEGRTRRRFVELSYYRARALLHEERGEFEAAERDRARARRIDEVLRKR